MARFNPNCRGGGMIDSRPFVAKAFFPLTSIWPLISRFEAGEVVFTRDPLVEIDMLVELLRSSGEDDGLLDTPIPLDIERLLMTFFPGVVLLTVSDIIILKLFTCRFSGL